MLYHIADVEANKKIKTIFFHERKKLNILVVFILQSYFAVPKTIGLRNTLFRHEIPNKRELQQVASNH